MGGTCYSFDLQNFKEDEHLLDTLLVGVKTDTTPKKSNLSKYVKSLRDVPALGLNSYTFRNLS